MGSMLSLHQHEYHQAKVTSKLQVTVTATSKLYFTHWNFKLLRRFGIEFAPHQPKHSVRGWGHKALVSLVGVKRKTVEDLHRKTTRD